ncbi:hypothetical protein KBC03_01495 [Patescibacteria group bacterium]|nr:hypothetical protein [Patescibacteria group bacterium]
MTIEKKQSYKEIPVDLYALLGSSLKSYSTSASKVESYTLLITIDKKPVVICKTDYGFGGPPYPYTKLEICNYEPSEDELDKMKGNDPSFPAIEELRKTVVFVVESIRVWDNRAMWEQIYSLFVEENVAITRRPEVQQICTMVNDHLSECLAKYGSFQMYRDFYSYEEAKDLYHSKEWVDVYNSDSTYYDQKLSLLKALAETRDKNRFHQMIPQFSLLKPVSE